MRNRSRFNMSDLYSFCVHCLVLIRRTCVMQRWRWNLQFDVPEDDTRHPAVLVYIALLDAGIIHDVWRRQVWSSSAERHKPDAERPKMNDTSESVASVSSLSRGLGGCVSWWLTSSNKAVVWSATCFNLRGQSICLHYVQSSLLNFKAFWLIECFIFIFLHFYFKCCFFLYTQL